jgi:UDP-2-acetamido-2-deoxy-ribo-hexuluronate aminotransferase
MIPLIDLGAQQARIRDKIDAGISRVLDHGMYIMGPEISAIEDRLAKAAGARHCISCSSGTDALILALLAKGLKPGEGRHSSVLYLCRQCRSHARTGCHSGLC